MVSPRTYGIAVAGAATPQDPPDWLMEHDGVKYNRGVFRALVQEGEPIMHSGFVTRRLRANRLDADLKVRVGL